MMGPQMPIGYRAVSNWGYGKEAARYIVGTVVFLPEDCRAVTSGRVSHWGLWRVEACFSISEDPEFYYRISPCNLYEARGLRLRTDWSWASDRLHVIPGKVDYTEGWRTLWEPQEIERG